MSFSLVDFIIGLTLINAMPHLVLGIWKGRMLSGLGFGNIRNILYSGLNIMISLGLYLYNYGLEHLLSNGMYLGGLTVVLAFFIIGKPMYKLWHVNYYEDNS